MLNKPAPDWAEPVPNVDESPSAYTMRAALSKLLSLLPCCTKAEAFSVFNELFFSIASQSKIPASCQDIHFSEPIYGFLSGKAGVFPSFPKQLDEKGFLFMPLPLSCGILAADTVVVRQGKILGKPSSEEHAFEMLKSLRGLTHEVFTGCALIAPSGLSLFYVCTQVTMGSFSDAILRKYVATKEPLDKAGSYAIQGKGSFLVSSISGSWSNVVGLPLPELLFSLLTLDIIKKS